MPITIEAQIIELQRILRACHQHYPQQVKDGSLAASEASHRQECLVFAIQNLQKLLPQSAGIAKSVSELCTPKQIVMIRAICRDLAIDVDIELQETLKVDCKVEELSRPAASAFIDHLKQLQELADVPIVRRAS